MRQAPLLLATEDELARAVTRWLEAPRLAVDLEASGMHAYRANVCTIQIATAEETTIVDALAVPITSLAPVLGVKGPLKIIHDVGFDARLLAEAGVVLGNVHDTALAASLLGKKQTGLDALMRNELGVSLDKRLQHHDWRKRPLGEPELVYLADDVAHLEALEAKLFAEVEQAGIADALDEETRHRLATAAQAVDVAVPPPYVRMADPKMPKVVLAALRALAAARETIGRTRDVPVQKVLPNDLLVHLADRRPKDTRTLEGILRGKRLSRDELDALVRAIALGERDGDVPAEERERWLTRPRVDPAEKKRERARHGKLTTFRRAKAKERGVEEQVILPGHVLRHLAEHPIDDLEALGRVPGFGGFRAAAFGAELVALLTRPDDTPLPDEPGGTPGDG